MSCASDYFTVTYLIETSGDLKEAGERIAREETTGKWVGKGEPTELFRKSQGWVEEIEELSKGKGLVKCAFPLINFLEDEDPYTAFWLFATGGPAFEFRDIEWVKILDFELPEKMLRNFPGPKFGLEGMKELVGLRKEDLLLGMFVKPCAGLTVEEVAERCGEAAMAGVDIVSDDEKMANPEYCPLEEKVKAVKEAIKRAERKVLYFAHITTSPDKIKERAYRALEAGADGLMIHILASGFHSLSILARDKNINVPIYVESGGRSIYDRLPNWGLSSVAFAKLIRLLGGDALQTGVVGGYLRPDVEIAKEMTRAMRAPLDGIKDCAPALAGGLKPANLGDNLAVFGMDVLAIAGVGILSHPLGTKAGVKAMRQAAEAYRLGISPREYAKEHEELRLVL
ncbi:MAG: RuBisCO large subunit C-terminal-like domain-containing protein [bacterium]